jgi:cob(I)alamin adenosyltransferase
MKIYTRAGDKGNTVLFGGTSIKKNHPRIIAYGGVDELNSYLGLLISLLKSDEKLYDIVDVLVSIQNHLFVMGSDLADPTSLSNPNTPKITSDMVLYLESFIDRFDNELKSLQFFILPGGNTASSTCHICRSVTRRIEIDIVSLSVTEVINQEIIRYINRLSDFLFVIARVINKRNNISDVPWKKNN